MICDNMPFSSNEFASFSKVWKFEIRTSSPTYARSNGQAEKGVHIAKNLIKKAREDGKDVNYALLEYRNHPVSQLGLSPSQILMSRTTRTKVPIKESLLQPKLQVEVKKKLEEIQEKVKIQHDKSARPAKELKSGDNVVYRKNGQWKPATIIRKHEQPRSYILENENQNLLRRNRVHLKKSSGRMANKSVDIDEEIFEQNENDLNKTCQVPAVGGGSLNAQARAPILKLNVPNNIDTGIVSRSGRILKPPARLNDYVK